MRLIPFSEVVERDIDEKIPCFRGRITRVNPYNSDTNAKGWWSIQNIELADPSNPHAKVKIKIFNREEIPKSWSGKVVEVMSAEGQRGGPKGVVVKQDTYKWVQGQPIKKIIEVRTEDGAYVELAGSDSGGGEQETRQAQQPARQNQSAPARNQPQNAPQGTRTAPQTQTQQQNAPAPKPERKLSPEEARAEIETKYRERVKNAAKFVAGKIQGFRIVFKAMDKLAEERAANGKPMTTEQFQGMCSSIFIAGDRTYQWEGLPLRPEDLEKYWPQSAPKDTTEGE